MSTQQMKAIDAIQEAQKIALGPFLFQAVVSLRKLGVFDLIFSKRKKGGISIAEIASELSISEYGVGVLLEIAESSDVVVKNEVGGFELTKTGYFLTYNETVNVNLNFTNEVCYEGLFHLPEAIKTGKPSGLKVLGEWDTIYEGLSQLTPEVQQAWFEFDHYYSDGVFQEALRTVFKSEPKLIFDIGANTGKFAVAACGFAEDVNVKMVDLPGQLKKALANVKNNGFENRVTGHEIDWLSDNPSIPEGAELIWMSQFLDCFSKEEIIKILSTCVASMSDDAELLIMETYTDRQKFDNAKFILEATSLYFTVMANGNSKMYAAKDMIELVDKAGLMIKEDINVGEYHTIFICKKK